MTAGGQSRKADDHFSSYKPKERTGSGQGYMSLGPRCHLKRSHARQKENVVNYKSRRNILQDH